jgi:hypothetical protein
MGWVDIFRRGRAAVPDHSWSVFGPKTKLRSLQPLDMLHVSRFPHLNLVQTRAWPPPDPHYPQLQLSPLACVPFCSQT